MVVGDLSRPVGAPASDGPYSSAARHGRRRRRRSRGRYLGRDERRAGRALPGLGAPAVRREQEGDLAADRKAEAGAAIAEAGGAVGLLNVLEDQLLLVLENADAGVDGADARIAIGVLEHRMVGVLHPLNAVVTPRVDVDRNGGLRIVLEQVEQHEAVDVRQAEIERDGVRLQLAAPAASVPAPAAVETTPFKPASRAMSSRMAAKVGSSSTIGTKGLVAQAVAIVARPRARTRSADGTRAPLFVVARGRAADRRGRGARRLERARTGVKVEPSPGGSSAPAVRRRAARAISRLMERPRPVPPYLRLVVPSACWNASKISFCLSCGMPMPVSVTEMAIALVAVRSTGWLGLQPLVAPADRQRDARLAR